ncbi:uncharacterized protein LOC111643754 [Copidosoma floridanum]|uniref:uncharacterized protein LOC111643754 n=1 Tax=Copidosoma floridanum TaxID=29053 RepID=UPI000C6F664A|nr:uncharacterized protein LOC111643754 [Copidosoma floridanum]
MNYSKESVVQALDEIKNGINTINTVSAKYGIPSNTLRDKMKKKYSDNKPGIGSVLTQQQENELEEWIFEAVRKGFPVSKFELIQTVKNICVNLGKPNPFTDNTPGRKWFNLFMKRHPKIVTRVSETVTLNKANVTEEKNLLDIEADRIFNTDETGVPLNSHPLTVLAPKGCKNVYKVVDNNEKENVSVLITANAVGELAPPFILFKGQSLPQNAAQFAPDDYVFGYSENGYMTAQNFFEWIANSFEPWLTKVGKKRPVVVFVDGHKSHMTFELSLFCLNHQIILIALHPNTTNVTQPLDVAFFRPFKVTWRKIHKQFCLEFSSVGIRKSQFATVLKKTLDQLDTKSILPNGFRKCGLMPINVEAVDFSRIFHRLEQNPSGEAPSPETSTTETSNFEAPIPDLLSTEASSFEALISGSPSTEVSSFEAPITDSFSTEASSFEAPITRLPSTEASSFESHITASPSTEALITVSPSTEASSFESHITASPSTEALITVSPSTEASGNE